MTQSASLWDLKSVRCCEGKIIDSPHRTWSKMVVDR